MSYLYLALAIATEIVGTSLLKVSDGFTNLWAAGGTVVAYVASFYFLSLTLRTVPVGVAYAVWSAVGIVAISLIGWVAFDQRLNAAALAGMALIIVGVVVLQVAVQGDPA
jgi:small multidrug resistance pump